VIELPKELFVGAFKNALDGHDETEVEDVEAKITELRRGLSQAVRDRRTIYEKKMASSETRLQDNTKKIAEMYERLCKISTTGRITVSGDEVMVPVGQIDIVFEGVTYDIGEFEVGIDLDDCTIQCYNKTRQVSDQHHPHVSSSGDACLGDASYGIGILLGDLELETVIYMMVEFLKSYNKGGCYQNVESWPVKGKELEYDESEDSQD
jgi:hypothetical protein